MKGNLALLDKSILSNPSGAFCAFRCGEYFRHKASPNNGISQKNMPHFAGAAECGKFAAPSRTGLKIGNARTEFKFPAA